MVAQQHRNEGRAHASMLWGPWAAGMAALDPALQARFAKAGLGAISPSEDGLHTGFGIDACSEETYACVSIL